MINQTVTIVNKSGKIVSTSKHLVNVFNEAKSAYNERKAEIKAVRKSEQDAKDRERLARKQLEDFTLEDDDDKSHRSHRSSRRGSDDGRSTIKRKPVPSRAGKDRPPMERGISDSFYANDRPRRASHQARSSPLRQEIDDQEPRTGELTRRHTDGMQLQRRHTERRPRRQRTSADSIDMDLAYGELPPPLPESRREEEIELKTKMNYLQRLLDEGNCVQHTVSATIDNLQKNPEALAAVALTLAEISNLVAKMAPGALMAMKGSFPAIVALLVSPQFAIAAGVGVGVTIIALGGYKIIKKIRAQNENSDRLLEQGVEARQDGRDGPAEDMDDLREISRIESWRRGIADEQVASVGTSVDGEFITPVARRTMLEEGRLTEADLKPLEAKSVTSSKSRTKKAKSTKAKSVASSGGSKSKVKSKKEPSMLKSLFKGSSTSNKKERVMEYV